MNKFVISGLPKYLVNKILYGRLQMHIVKYEISLPNLNEDFILLCEDNEVQLTIYTKQEGWVVKRAVSHATDPIYEIKIEEDEQ